MNKKSFFSFAFLLIVHISSLFAQEAKLYSTIIKKIENGRIIIDGEISEEAWLVASQIDSFYMSFPHDDRFASVRTVVKMLYDHENLYISAEMLDSEDWGYVSASLKRDFDLSINDHFTVNLGTYHDGVNGFTFSVTPFGVEREGLISDGKVIDTSWDSKWKSSVKRGFDKWVTEISIPFKTFRYTKGTSNWTVNFIRSVQSLNEISTWKPVPINFDANDMAFAGELIFEEPLEKTGLNENIIPYTATRLKDNKITPSLSENTIDAGIDAKIAITPALNLDLTFNPDFSEAEVDQQVIDLQRFEIFFPERRQFFVENSDLFARFGNAQLRPFFSRRIGLARDTSTDIVIQNRIWYGARMSGKLSNSMRVGLLNMQTAEDEEAGIKAQNYTVAAIQEKVFSRSSIGAIFINRHTFEDTTNSKFTRLAGLDYNLQSKNGSWSGKFFFHKAFKDEIGDDSYTFSSNLVYDKRHLILSWNQEYVGVDYEINDIGFVNRRGHWRVEPFIGLRFFPKSESSFITRHRLRYHINMYTNLDKELTDRNQEINYEMLLRNRMIFSINFKDDFIQIIEPFKPTINGELSVGSEHKFQTVDMSFSTDPRKKFYFKAGGSIGGFYNGDILTATSEMRFRFQPFGAFSLNVNYNQLEMPEGFDDANYWIVSSRIDLSLSKKLFITNVLQYNNQRDNINHNTRLQWRFKPVSDFFIVYSENYFSENLGIKNRAIVAKLTYWFNL
jgi:hypothetical protein